MSIHIITLQDQKRRQPYMKDIELVRPLQKVFESYFVFMELPGGGMKILKDRWNSYGVDTIWFAE